MSVNLCALSWTGLHLLWWLCRHLAFHSFCGVAASASMRTWNWRRSRRSVCYSVYYIFIFRSSLKTVSGDCSSRSLVSSHLLFHFLIMQYHFTVLLSPSSNRFVSHWCILFHTVLFFNPFLKLMSLSSELCQNKKMNQFSKIFGT